VTDRAAFATSVVAGSSHLDGTAFATSVVAGSSHWNATAFAGFAGAVVLLFLLLARVSQAMLSTDGPDGGAHLSDSTSPPTVPGADDDGRTDDPDPAPDGEWEDDPKPDLDAEPVTDVDPAGEATADTRPFGTAALLVNVLATHGLFALVVAGAAVYWQVPPSVVGIAGPLVPAVAWGTVLGIALYAADEVGAEAADRLGVGHDETLRELLAPSSTSGWGLLLLGVLPAIAVGEEFLFRGVLVGAYATGLGLPVWGLAVASSLAFALGHGAQGRAGILVTGLLGFVLAAAFVVSGSLLLVVVAHYLVNALEFVVHEALGLEWGDG
jgi:membrane protease YdiL (CAAX protease family)